MGIVVATGSAVNRRTCASFRALRAAKCRPEVPPVPHRRKQWKDARNAGGTRGRPADEEDCRWGHRRHWLPCGTTGKRMESTASRAASHARASTRETRQRHLGSGDYVPGGGDPGHPFRKAFLFPGAPENRYVPSGRRTPSESMLYSSKSYSFRKTTEPSALSHRATACTPCEPRITAPPPSAAMILL